MNTQKLRNIIALYKENFSRINHEEIYKWQAVKQFQDHWDIEATNFQEMLEKSLSKSKNLMDSGNYFPRRMLNFFAGADPERVRAAFKRLFNEGLDLIDRIEKFKETMQNINREFSIKPHDFQDTRAVMVYLCLKYPDLYYFYKYEMVRDFVPLIDYPVRPIKGRAHNVLEFQSMCDIIKVQLSLDSELLELHRTRIGPTEYHDRALNILTQDVIYAAVRHVSTFQQASVQLSAKSRLTQTDMGLEPVIRKPSLKGRFKNYVENEKENKRIGDLGELLVMQYETEKLKGWGSNKVPEHSAKKEGDGLGYDILSYDRQGDPIYIEVKTTKWKKETPFYITGHEKARSIIDRQKFFLYRLFEYSEDLNSAQFYIRGGDLTELCGNAILFYAVFNKSN